MRQTNKPWKLYDSKFSVHFSPISSSGKEEKEEEERKVRRVVERYEPTIVCYNRHDHVMEVRTDIFFISLLLIMFNYIHGYVLYM